MLGGHSLLSDIMVLYLASTQIISLVRLTSVPFCTSLIKHVVLGELEMTLFRTFCMGNNLRAAIPSFKFPANPYFLNFLERMGRAFGFKSQGTFFNDVLALSSASNTDPASYTLREENLYALRNGVYKKLLDCVNEDRHSESPLYGLYDTSDMRAIPLDRRGQSLGRLKKDGVWYSTSATKNRGIGNSYITFRRGPSDSLPAGAGQISEIFLHRRDTGDKTTVEPFLVINEYQSLAGNHEAHDPFRRINHLDARLYYNAFLPEQRLIKLSDIISHVATLAYTPQEIGKECIVAVSLDRVSIY